MTTTVSDIFSKALPQINEGGMKAPFLSAVQTVIDVIVRRLWQKHSDLLKASLNPIHVNAGTNSFDLPADFLGFDGFPYFSLPSGKATLTPLPPALRGSFSQPGTPRYYELFGKKVILYPTPDYAVDVSGVYYKDAQKLAGMESEIPFDGLFDLVIVDAVLMIGQGGIAVTGTQQFQFVVHRYVDEICQIRNPKSVSFFHPPTGNQRRFI